MSYGMAVATALGLGTIAFAYLSVNFKDKHAPLKWLFSILAVASTTFNMLIMSTVSKNAGYDNVAGMVSWVGYGFIIVLIIMIAYFLIWFMYNSLKKTSKKAYGEGSGP
mgnify:CR=1 FL=1